MGKVDKKIIFLIIIIFACSVFLGNEISNYRQLTYELNYFTFEDMSRKVITGALGEFGKTLASYIWIKSDFYWHEYSGDWRSEQEIMPLIKMVTFLDPTQTQAYDFGGYQLAMNLKKVKEGAAYLKEGLKNNPESPELNYTYAFISFKKIKNYHAAIEYGKRAFTLSEDKAVKMDSLRIIYNSYAELGNYPAAIYAADLMLKINPQDPAAKWKIELYKNKLK